MRSRAAYLWQLPLLRHDDAVGVPREHSGARHRQTQAQRVHVFPAQGGEGPRGRQGPPAADARRRAKSVRRPLQKIVVLRVALAAISGFLFAVAFPNYAVGWLIFI